MNSDAIAVSRALRVLARQVEYFDGDVSAAICTLKDTDKGRIDDVAVLLGDEAVSVTGKGFSIVRGEDCVVLSVIPKDGEADYVEIPLDVVNVVADGLRYVHDTNAALSSPFRR